MKALPAFCIITIHFIVRLYAMNQWMWLPNEADLDSSLKKLALLIVLVLLIKGRAKEWWQSGTIRTLVSIVIGSGLSNLSELVLFSQVADYIPIPIGTRIYLMNFSDMTADVTLLIMMVILIREQLRKLR